MIFDQTGMARQALYGLEETHIPSFSGATKAGNEEGEVSTPREILERIPAPSFLMSPS